MESFTYLSTGQGPVENQGTVEQSCHSEQSTDHAFPALDAGNAQMPPFFRFMWASR